MAHHFQREASECKEMYTLPTKRHRLRRRPGPRTHVHFSRCIPSGSGWVQTRWSQTSLRSQTQSPEGSSVVSHILYDPSENAKKSCCSHSTNCLCWKSILISKLGLPSVSLDWKAPQKSLPLIYRGAKLGLKNGRELPKGTVGDRAERKTIMDSLLGILSTIGHGLLVLPWIKTAINIMSYQFNTFLLMPPMAPEMG